MLSSPLCGKLLLRAGGSLVLLSMAMLAGEARACFQSCGGGPAPADCNLTFPVPIGAGCAAAATGCGGGLGCSACSCVAIAFNTACGCR
jgi:hypothetical protein